MDPAIVLLGIYPMKTHVNTKTCTCMFIAALFIIAKTWKQPRYPSVGKWINCGVPDNEILFITKKNELSSHKKTWRNLKCI